MALIGNGSGPGLRSRWYEVFKEVFDPQRQIEGNNVSHRTEQFGTMQGRTGRNQIPGSTFAIPCAVRTTTIRLRLSRHSLARLTPGEGLEHRV